MSLARGIEKYKQPSQAAMRHDLGTSNEKVQADKASEHAALGGVHEVSTGNREVQATQPSDHSASGGAHD